MNLYNSSELLIRHREKLLSLDSELIRLLAERMNLSSEIGKLKFENQLNIEQNDFWSESSLKRKELSLQYQLNPDFTEELFSLIHKESINIQEKLFNELENEEENSLRTGKFKLPPNNILKE